MSDQVRALYDFTGNPGTAELDIVAGEVLTVTRRNVGGGWFEGHNTQGKIGLFPEAYVEEMQAEPPSNPPPVLPQSAATGNRYDQTADEWETQYNNTDQNYTKAVDAWEDDWDDDTYSEIGPGEQASSRNQLQRSVTDTNVNEAPSYPLPGMPMSDFNDDAVSHNGPHAGTVSKKNINRFSTFVKSGGESYILGTLNIVVSEADKICIHQITDGYNWTPITTGYSVVVASPKKESKFKGIKSFIAYQLTPSFNNIQVSRRYKHFDWLHERLTDKFCLIPIPPLPDKQISGRYEEQFIEHRRVQLQEFVDWVCRHPVLSRCEVWQHFLTCTDEKRWKAGKRQAEKDQLVGANFCITIFPPEKALLQSQVETQTEQCATFIHAMDSAVKNITATCLDQTKKHQGPYKREYQKIGEAFYSLGNALGLDEGSVISTSKLTSAMKMTGGAYIDIGRMFDEQPKYDWEPLGDKLHIYKGIIGSFPDVLAVQKGAVQKRKECERLTSDHKMDVIQLNEVIRRTDVVSYALLAEINHFKVERTTDLKVAMQRFLKEQISFYKKVVNKLETTLTHFED